MSDLCRSVLCRGSAATDGIVGCDVPGDRC
jgi:hypothetical protein